MCILLMACSGGLGRGEVLGGSFFVSLITGRSKMVSSFLASGGGMGYLSTDSFIRDRFMF